MPEPTKAMLAAADEAFEAGLGGKDILRRALQPGRRIKTKRTYVPGIGTFVELDWPEKDNPK